MKRYFMAGLGIVLALSLGAIFYGAWLNERGEVQITRRMEERRLTQNRDELTGVFYIPVDKGKRVEPGMTVQLAPNGVDVTQTGSLIGVVKSVSQYPISAEGVRKGLGNAQLAQYVLSQGGGAAVEVKFDLVKDASSESGYLWTSVVGKHRPITAGSFCTGSIVIEREPPIEKVFYKISQWLRNR